VMDTEESAPPAPPPTEQVVKAQENNIVPESKVLAVLERICVSMPQVAQARHLYSSSSSSLAEMPSLILPCLELLPSPSQAQARLVCKAWANCLPPSSTTVDLRGSSINSHSLATVARLQPDSFYLGETGVTKQQLTWLLPKLPNIRVLSLSSLDFSMSVSALSGPCCPSLSVLDLRQVSGLTDPAVNLLLHSRDGKRSGLANLRSLNVSGTEVSDVSLRYIAQSLPSLSCLTMARCSKLTDAGLVQLGDSSLPVSVSLTTLDMRECPGVTDLAPLSSCQPLKYINFHQSGVTNESVAKFLTNASGKLKLFGGSVIAPI